MQDQTSTNYVGLEDVRQALLDMGNVSPFNTNAGKVRDKIDRGSNGTIQKHLIFLRNQIIAAAQPQAEQSVPKPPQDAVEMLWAAAWGAAQTKTLARLESLSAERDGLRATTIAQTADLEAFTEQLDALASQVQEHVSAAERVHAVEIQKTATAAAQSAAQTQALAVLQAELTRVTEASDHAAELAIRDAQIERQALQSIIDRQSDQLGELKALRITAQAHDESLANVQAAALATAEKTQANMQIQAAALATAQAEIVRIREAATHAAELANLASEKDRQNLLSIIEQMKLSPKDGK